MPFDYPQIDARIWGCLVEFGLKCGTYVLMIVCGAVRAMKRSQDHLGAAPATTLDETAAGNWIDNEVVGCQFQDARHGDRLRQLLEQLSARTGAATQWACQGWANTKAAYRFFGNGQISEANILAGHFASTREGFVDSGGGQVLVLHDTTEFSYRHEDTEPIGILKKIPAGYGRP